MQTPWIPLQCPACDHTWENGPESLPEPGNDLSCVSCGTSRSVVEFVKTQRGWDILNDFHGAASS